MGEAKRRKQMGLGPRPKVETSLDAVQRHLDLTDDLPRVRLFLSKPCDVCGCEIGKTVKGQNGFEYGVACASCNSYLREIRKKC